MKRRRGWLLPLVVLVLAALAVVEVWLLIQVGRWIGVWPTVLILVLEAVVGAWLLRREGTRTWKGLQGSFATGRMPARELTDAALVLVGGVLLMLPGFVTDLVGFCCVLPVTRPLARRLLAWLVVRRVERAAAPLLAQYDRARPFDPSSVIEGETVDTPSGPTRPAAEIVAGEIEEPRA